MIGKEVLEEKAIPLSEVRTILKKRSEEGELNYEQKISYEYAKEFGKASQTKIKQALEKLKELGIQESEAMKIVDLQPKTKEELGLIFEKIKFNVDDNLKKIQNIVKDLK